MICYVIFFYHVTVHNNSIAAAILQPSVIKQRNRTNAISIIGLFATWTIQIGFILINSIILYFFELEWVREYLALLKDSFFFLLPLTEIVTSAPIKRFLKEN
jgi:hypothetical protein